MWLIYVKIVSWISFPVWFGQVISHITIHNCFVLYFKILMYKLKAFNIRKAQNVKVREQQWNNSHQTCLNYLYGSLLVMKNRRKINHVTLAILYTQLACMLVFGWYAGNNPWLQYQAVVKTTIGQSYTCYLGIKLI